MTALFYLPLQTSAQQALMGTINTSMHAVQQAQDDLSELDSLPPLGQDMVNTVEWFSCQVSVLAESSVMHSVRIHLGKFLSLGEMETHDFFRIWRLCLSVAPIGGEYHRVLQAVGSTMGGQRTWTLGSCDLGSNPSSSTGCVNLGYLPSLILHFVICK